MAQEIFILCDYEQEAGLFILSVHSRLESAMNAGNNYLNKNYPGSTERFKNINDEPKADHFTNLTIISEDLVD